MTDFTEKDKAQLAEKGITKEQVIKQIGIFEQGIPYVRLEKAAVAGEGITRLDSSAQQSCIKSYESVRHGLDLLKFVPASGAASRMFKALFNFLEGYDLETETLKAYLSRSGNSGMKTFAENLEHFPFYDLVAKRIRGKAGSKDQEAYLFVKEMLGEDKLNFGFLPKGLLPFHNYGTYLATPFEEHLMEASAYASRSGNAQLHFTISEQHGELFNKEFSRIKERVSAAAKTSFDVSYSFQKSATDTIAVTPENEPFRNEDGSLLFRPGGHGALIENLDEQEADILFIKNIDNVVVSSMAEEVNQSKKVLAGYLCQLQKQAHAYAELLEGELSGEQLLEIKTFLIESLNVRLAENFPGYSLRQQIDILKDKINRPIRVCGMVKNEGEPGGGPFWVRDSNGNISLQIIESAQVDKSDARQLAIFRDSTHFNPVDLVCGVKDHRGQKFRLQNFVDSRQGFITLKTQEGKPLKALELPGLWNGGMAFWNTVFVEVPLRTFNPVKTVNDLLKPAHQARRTP